MKFSLLFLLLINIYYIGNVFSFNAGSEKVNFSQSIIYQKKSVKIYGKTIPNLKIIIKVGKEEYKIKSSTKGSYSLKINTLKPGKYRVVSKISIKNKYYLVPRKKEIILTSKYVNKMRSYYLKKKKKILFNPGVEKYIKKLEKPKTVINFLLLYILLGIMSLLMMFLVLRKNDLI